MLSECDSVLSGHIAWPTLQAVRTAPHCGLIDSPGQSVTGFLATDCPDEVTRLRCGNLEDADDRTDMVIEDRNLRQLPE